MEEITLEDGSTRQVLTEEERTELQTKAGKVDDLTAKEEDFNKDKAELEELRNQPGAEGMKNLREANKRLKVAAKAKGIEVDDEGNVVEKPQHLTAEEIDQRADARFEKKAVESKFQDVLDTLDKDGQEVLKNEFEFLTQGKEVTSKNVKKFIDASFAAAGLEQTKPNRRDHLATFSGAGPSPRKNSSAPTETESQMGDQFGVSEDSFKKGGGIDLRNK